MDIKALKNDLLKEYCYRTELHAHTSPASSCSEIAPEDVIEIYKNLGYDAVTIANRIIGCVNAPSLIQRVIPYCLDIKTDIESYRKNRDLLCEILKENNTFGEIFRRVL